MTINKLATGESAQIDSIKDELLRAQLLRFGIIEGCQIECHSKIPFGPVVLKFGGQQIALGRENAKQIKISK